VLVGQAALLRSMVEGRSGSDLLDPAANLAQGLAAIRRSLEERASALVSVTR